MTRRCSYQAKKHLKNVRVIKASIGLTANIQLDIILWMSDQKLSMSNLITQLCGKDPRQRWRWLEGVQVGRCICIALQCTPLPLIPSPSLVVARRLYLSPWTSKTPRCLNELHQGIISSYKRLQIDIKLYCHWWLRGWGVEMTLIILAGLNREGKWGQSSP